MKYIFTASLVLITLFSLSCEDLDNFLDTDPDPLITQADANSKNYNLTTPRFGMQVSIEGGVAGETSDILDALDFGAADFFQCQFGMDPDVIGNSVFDLGDGQFAQPMDQLRVLVAPFTFECEAVDKDVCAGIYYPGSDLIIIAKDARFQCEEFAFWRHELGHRYGLALDHSNQDDFDECTEPDSCIGLPIDVGI